MYDAIWVQIDADQWLHETPRYRGTSGRDIVQTHGGVASGYGGNDFMVDGGMEYIHPNATHYPWDMQTYGDGGGNSIIYGGDGDDVIIGGWRNDSLYGGAGDDLIAGDEVEVERTGYYESGLQRLNIFFQDRGAGNDKLSGGAGDDLMHGGSGDDRMYGGSGQDNLIGGKGNDKLYGGTGPDLLLGVSGDDHLQGGPGPDFMMGDDGNDTLVPKSGGDVMYGGAGRDTFDFTYNPTYADNNDEADDYDVVMDFSVANDRMVITADAYAVVYRHELPEDLYEFLHDFDDGTEGEGTMLETTEGIFVYFDGIAPDELAPHVPIDDVVIS